MAKQATAQVSIPKEVQQEMTLLQGFRDLVGERFGYFLGRRMKTKEMNEASTEERKEVNKIRKEISDNLETFIKESDFKTYSEKTDALVKARKVLAVKTKPFRDKISPLRKAQNYLDSVAIPDALKELKTPLTPRFSLSKWVTDAIAQSKKK